jgi:hypothetical protein
LEVHLFISASPKVMTPYSRGYKAALSGVYHIVVSCIWYLYMILCP